jgi:hypothetical protein
VLPSYCEVKAICEPSGENRGNELVTGAAGEAPRDAAFFANRVEFARVTKNDLVSIGRWETKEPRRIRRLLAGDGTD